MAGWWPSYITQRARQLGLDPRAVLAVASQEGLSGRPGDQGTSFGPFQLHVGGALPAGRGQAWAESQAGIDYALQQIAGVARGQRGGQAIASIVSRFERPANPSGEIARAAASYGSSPGVAQALPTASPFSQATAGSDTTGLRRQLAQNLIAANQQSARGQTPDYSSVFRTITALRSPSGAQVPVQVQAGVPAGKARNAVALARSLEGTPYVWGGSAPGGFDCSGLVQYVLGRQGVRVPRTSQQQWQAGTRIPPGQLQPGDAVFFEMGQGGPGHEGLYIGGGNFIEAPHRGAVVRVSSLSGRSDFVGARRFG